MSSMPDRVRELLAAPSLAGLAYALRNPEVWPKEYREAGWHFPSCTRCAMGLGHALWNGFDVTGSLGISMAEACRLFGGSRREGPYAGIDRRFITPTHVADAIDAFLLRRAA